MYMYMYMYSVLYTVQDIKKLAFCCSSRTMVLWFYWSLITVAIVSMYNN